MSLATSSRCPSSLPPHHDCIESRGDFVVWEHCNVDVPALQHAILKVFLCNLGLFLSCESV